MLLGRLRRWHAAMVGAAAWLKQARFVLLKHHATAELWHELGPRMVPLLLALERGRYQAATGLLQLNLVERV